MPSHLDESRKIDGASDAATAASEQSDRRRPGRLQDVNPSLIPLLRNSPLRAADAYDELRPRRREDLAAGQGIMVAVLLSGVFWAALFLTLR